MTLGSTVRNLVSKSFDVISDLKGLGTYNRTGVETYDPQTDSTSYVGSSVVPNVRMLPTEITSTSQVDGIPIRPGDMILLIPALDLSFEPSENDTILWESRVWEVQRVMTVPGKSLWKLMVRKS